jgi:hypothetical protein
MSQIMGEAEPLHQAVQRWARQIRASSGRTVETILATAENLLGALKELEPHGTKARQMLALEARLTLPLMAKLEAIGRHAPMLRLKVANLPPYVSSLYALTQKPFADFMKAIDTDLRGLSSSEIARLFASTSPVSRRRLMTIAIPSGLPKEARRELMTDIRAAIERIGDAHRIDLIISPRAMVAPKKERPRQSPEQRPSL